MAKAPAAGTDIAAIMRHWTPEYTCGCGLHVHPTRRNPAAIHIRDCPFDFEQQDARWAAEHIQRNPGTTYTEAYRARAVYAPNLGAAEGLV